MSSNWDTKSLEPDAFELHRESPWEFRWVNIALPGDPAEMVYKKCETKKVIGVRSTGVSTRGGAKAPTGLAAMSFPCPMCSKSHSPVVAC